MAQQSCANYVQAARICFPDGTPVRALPPGAGPIGTPDGALLLIIGNPDSGLEIQSMLHENCRYTRLSQRKPS
eukprot:2684372-Amphidinium_carterae.1